jgi:serine phosphatase RsbU (regulator of sigma subunit)
MSTNPFVFEKPVAQPDVACFRDTRAVDRIVNGLLLGNYYTLLGPRVSGLTSMTQDVLRTVREQEERCRCLYIDLQTLQRPADERSLFQGLAERGQEVLSETAQSWSEVTNCARFREAVANIVRGKTVRLVLGLDSLDTDILPHELVKMLVRCSRVLYNQRLTDPEYYKISVLISGSQSPYALSTGSGSPFNIAERYWLRDLGPEEAGQLIRMGQHLSGVLFDDAAISRIIASTRGDKYFIQRICHICVQEAQDAGHKIVTQATVSEAIERLTSMYYREDRCFTLLVRSLKREPDLAGILVDLLEGKEVIAGERQADVNKMQLTGIVRVDEGRYGFRNEIYERFLFHRKEMLEEGRRIHDQTKRLISLHDVTLEIGSALDPETAVERAAWMVLGASRADTVAICLFDRTIGGFRLEAIASREDPHLAGGLLKQVGIAKEVMASQEPSIEEHAFCSGCDLHRNSCSCIWVPLSVGNERLGVMVITFEGHHDFSDEIMSAKTMASHLTSALIRMRLIDVLRAVGGIDVTSASRDEILQKIVDHARRLLNVPVAMIWVREGDEPELRVGAYSGTRDEQYVKAFRLRADLEPTRSFLQRLDPLFLRNVQTASGYRHKDRAREMGWHSLLTMPLKARDHPIGILEVYTNEEWQVTPWQRELLALLAKEAAVAIENARLYEQAQQAIARELAMAGQIQASFLPRDIPHVPGWQLAATLEPARETGGDFYDFIRLPNGRWGLVVADVADKGFGSALYMASCCTLLRTYAVEYHTRPDHVLSATNGRLLADTQAGLFVTAFYGILDPATGALVYCNAGHPPPYLLSAQNTDKVRALPRTGMPLGIAADATWEPETIQLGPGDVLLLYTDGITEALDEQEEFFQSERLLEVVQTNLGRSAQEIQDVLLAKIHQFIGQRPQFDDIALLIVARDSQ